MGSLSLPYYDGGLNSMKYHTSNNESGPFPQHQWVKLAQNDNWSTNLELELIRGYTWWI